MVAISEHKNGHRVLRPVTFENEAFKGNGKKAGNGRRKPVALVPPDLLANQKSVAPLAVAEPVAAKPSVVAIPNEFQRNDAAQQLDHVREALFGPTRDLQEARLNELVQILEEQDRETRVAHDFFQGRFQLLEKSNAEFGELLLTTNQLIADNAMASVNGFADANKRVDEVSESMLSELRRAEKAHKENLDQQAAAFEAKLERLSSIMTKQFEDMAHQHKQSMQLMAEDFAKGLRELAGQSKSSDDSIVEQMNARFAQVDAGANQIKQSIQTLSTDFAAELRDVVEQANSADERIVQQMNANFVQTEANSRQALQTATTELMAEIGEFAAQSKTTDERIIEQMTARFEQVAAYAEDEKRRNIKVLSEGLSGLSDRLQSL